MKLNKAFATRVRELFKNMSLIIKELGVSYIEFFDSPVFDFDNLELD